MSQFKRVGSIALNRKDNSVFTYGPAEIAPPGNQAGITEYWRLLWRRKWTVALIAVLGGIAGLAAALLTKPVYTARATLEVQDVSPSSTNVTPASGDYQGYSALSDIQTQVRILQSESIAKRSREKLEARGWPGAPPPAPKDTVPGKSEGVESRESLLLAASNGMRVREAGPTRIIELAVDSTDKVLVAELANTAASEFIDENMEERWKMSQRTGEWLGRELDDMRSKLGRSEYDLQAYARKEGLLFTPTGGKDEGNANVSGQKLLELQTALATASTERVSKQSKLSVANGGAAEGIPDVLNDQALREYQSKLTELKKQIAELSAIYTSDFPRIKRLQGQVDSLQSAFDAQRKAVVNKIRNEYDEALMREKLLSADFDSQAQTVNLDAEKGIQYNILRREVDSNRQLYEAMLQRVKESRVNAALRASNIRVVDPAVVPNVPSRPSKVMDLAMGLLIGSFTGIGLVVIRERSDGSFRVPGEAPRWLNVPELGVVPRNSAHAKLQLKPNALSLDPGSPITALLTSIVFSKVNGRAPRVIVVTSANPAEGKTTIAANLALKGAETGKRVLLVDADFAGPRLHQLFTLPNERGLSNMMQQPDMADDEFLSCISQMSAGFAVLTSGPPISSASDLLVSGQVPQILARLNRSFDMIVIDTPPTPQFAHARILGHMADGIILVMRSGRTSREAAAATVQRLTEDGSYIMGTVLNDWNPRTSPGKYYWQHGNRAYLRSDS